MALATGTAILIGSAIAATAAAGTQIHSSNMSARASRIATEKAGVEQGKLLDEAEKRRKAEEDAAKALADTEAVRSIRRNESTRNAGRAGTILTDPSATSAPLGGGSGKTLLGT